MKDPRIISTTVVDPRGPLNNIGIEYVGVAPVTINGKEHHLPKMLPGLNDYISTAHAEADALRIWPSVFADLDERGAVPYQPNAEAVFNFLASAGTVTTSAVAGLEAFANHHLARFCAPATFDVRGQLVEPAPTVEVTIETASEAEIRIYTFAELVNEDLHTRYGKILPAPEGKPRPTSERWWPKLRQVQGLAALNRHGITDPVIRKGLTGTKSLVQRLCDHEYRGASAMMLEVFAYFAPGWIDEQRRELLPPPPEV